MKEECMQNLEQKVVIKRKMEVTIETNENDMGSRTEKRARVEKKLSIDHKEKLVFLSNCLEVWLSPSVAQMEDELMRDAFLDDDHNRETLAMRLDLQFQSFANFASYLLGGNLFEEIMVTTKKRWFQGALLLRYAAGYMFQSSNLWSYDENILCMLETIFTIISRSHFSAQEVLNIRLSFIRFEKHTLRQPIFKL